LPPRKRRCAILPTALVYVGDMIPFKARLSVTADLLAAVSARVADINTNITGVGSFDPQRCGLSTPNIDNGQVVLFNLKQVPTQLAVECHVNGIVTSASLMVYAEAVDDALSLSRANPELAVGLHWDVVGEDEREFDLADPDAVRQEFELQLERFLALAGRQPTHRGGREWRPAPTPGARSSPPGRGRRRSGRRRL